MVTNNDEIFYCALLQGSYNKLCKEEIPRDHPLSKFALTGFGLKLRAHPLAIAMANEQMSHLDSLINALKDIQFLKMPSFNGRISSWYGFVMQYQPELASWLSRERFVSALHSEGLVEVDIPGSTGLLSDLPLFTDSSGGITRFTYPEGKNLQSYPNAERFYNNAIKLPVWAFEDESKWVDLYIEGFLKVAEAVVNSDLKES